MKWQHLFAGSVASLCLVGVTVAGCGGSDSGGGDNYFPEGGAGNKDGQAGGGEGGGGGNDSICLLNDCDLDRDCKDCTGGRTTCSQKEHRCVACGPTANGATCGSGQYCTMYGDCVANGVTCPVDGTGNPTVACKTSADCGACDPKHQVCADGKCSGCSPDDVTTRVPSGLKPALVTGPSCPLKTSSSLPVVASQIRIVRSLDAVTMRAPSGLNAALLSGRRCPLRTRSSFPVATSQTRAVGSGYEPQALVPNA